MIFNCFYLLFLSLASPFYIVSLIRRDKHRVGLKQKFGFDLPDCGSGKKIWIHAVSVGEVLLCRPLIAQFEKERPDITIVLSVTTATGHKMAQRHFAHHVIIFYPFDFTWAVRRMIRAVSPELILLAELEVWPNFIAAARQAAVPVAVINGRLTERSCKGFTRFNFLLTSMFEGISYYWMQTDLYAQRVEKLGIDPKRIAVLGSMKYDVLDFAAQHERITSLIEGLQQYPSRKIIVAGSTHDPEERYLLDAVSTLLQDNKITLILVPRHPERYDSVISLVRGYGFDCQRKTALDAGENYQDGAVILLDTMGELSQVYGISDVVYIGGTLIKHGGQNLMEPAALGKPIICGPSVYNFQQTYDVLAEAGATIDVADAKELHQECTARLLTRNLTKIGKRGVESMAEQAGSTDKHFQAITKALS